MRPTEIFLFFAICCVLGFAAADFTFSIKSSNVPNLEYEVDAIECLQEAYVLYPDNLGNKRNDAFSKLFQNKHADSYGWNIADGCVSSYLPNATVFIDVLVQDSVAATENVIKIFN